jgi:TetR/AcrR family transcriptional repressor of nem operon
MPGSPPTESPSETLSDTRSGPPSESQGDTHTEPQATGPAAPGAHVGARKKPARAGIRARRKAASRERILKAAARIIREEGMAGAGVAEVMQAAGLTHGAFYSHFRDKDAMLAAALELATQHREAWLNGADELPESAWIEKIARLYLSEAHRDAPGEGCPYPVLAGEMAHANARLKDAFEREVQTTIGRMEERLTDEGFMTARDRAYGLLALFVGAMVLARAGSDESRTAFLNGARRFASASAHRST